MAEFLLVSIAVASSGSPQAFIWTKIPHAHIFIFSLSPVSILLFTHFSISLFNSTFQEERCSPVWLLPWHQLLSPVRYLHLLTAPGRPTGKDHFVKLYLFLIEVTIRLAPSGALYLTTCYKPITFFNVSSAQCRSVTTVVLDRYKIIDSTLGNSPCNKCSISMQRLSHERAYLRPQTSLLPFNATVIFLWWWPFCALVAVFSGNQVGAMLTILCSQVFWQLVLSSWIFPKIDQIVTLMVTKQTTKLKFNSNANCYG